ncbi:MAG: YtxH domain-containing protein [Pedobacter sp.]|nr:YtxH domain-containing protein [Pedobacter sp.]
MMNNRKLVEKFLSQKSNKSDVYVAVALVAGLAAGAVVSILFAPKKGSNVRKNITDIYTSFKDRILGYPDLQESALLPDVPHFIHHIEKKRKSDVKDLISEAHLDGHHPS